jgi:prevent-host-death family protein
MAVTHVSIGQVKRDISELANRVAFGGERIVLTSRGKPKAALVSIADYERLEQEKAEEQEAAFDQWLQRRDKLVADILERRGGEPIDMDKIWEEAHADLEKRHDFLLGD